MPGEPLGSASGGGGRGVSGKPSSSLSGLCSDVGERMESSWTGKGKAVLRWWIGSSDEGVLETELMLHYEVQRFRLDSAPVRMCPKLDR